MQAGKGYFLFKRLFKFSKTKTNPRAIAKDLHEELEPSVTSRLPRDCIQQQSCHPPYSNISKSVYQLERKRSQHVHLFSAENETLLDRGNALLLFDTFLYSRDLFIAPFISHLLLTCFARSSKRDICVLVFSQKICRTL